MHVLINRLAAARAFLQRFGIDLILFTDLRDVRYLSGFTGSEGALLLGEDEVFLFTDSRYTTQAANEAGGCTIVEFRDMATAIASQVKEIGAGSIGFQGEHVTFSLHADLLHLLPGLLLVALGPEIAALRSVKDCHEIEILTKTAAIASESFGDVISMIRPGISEKELALRLELALRTRGADGKSFDFIVASGERGALPHGRASEKMLCSGELVTVDFGAILDGYASDETVTVAVGRIDAKQREIYQIVRDAHDMAIEAVRPGVALKHLDAVARDHISEKGFGDFFRHGLGHGVGLDVHEKPVVSFRSEGKVLEGMVFTIEPGIYLPSWGGVRIEDTVCVTSGGCKLLTKVTKDLLVL
jgi:Xaa-Pro aminopeptidase